MVNHQWLVRLGRCLADGAGVPLLFEHRVIVGLSDAILGPKGPIFKVFPPIPSRANAGGLCLLKGATASIASLGIAV